MSEEVKWYKSAGFDVLMLFGILVLVSVTLGTCQYYTVTKPLMDKCLSDSTNNIWLRNACVLKGEVK